jgi:hypothetical protein
MMKPFLLILTIYFLSCKSSSPQQSSLPLTVSLKIEKVYEVKFPKNYFAYEVNRGTYYIKTDSVKQKLYDIEIIFILMMLTT